MHMRHMYISIMFIMAVANFFTMRSPFLDFSHYSTEGIPCQAFFLFNRQMAKETKQLQI